MHKTRLICTSESLNREFERCCKEYSSLHIVVAWCGDPKLELPHKYLQSFGKSLVATIGVAFHNTHPDAIGQLMTNETDVRIVPDNVPLHPKLYVFTKGARYACSLEAPILLFKASTRTSRSMRSWRASTQSVKTMTFGVSSGG